ncbi:MAG: GNAT family N-acetyltransferase [Salibacteraceae bacterium]
MFDPKKEYILENDRVKLIPLQLEHKKELLPYSLNEPELWKYSLTPASGVENLENYIKKALQDRQNLTSYPFVVLDKAVNKIIGSTRFYDFQPHHKTTQLGFTWYGKDYQGSGINKPCKFLMLEFAFDVMELQRVEFRADVNNERSIAAMKSIGCVPEGILRNNCASETGRRDSIVLSILQSEWKSTVKAQLLKKI